MATMNYLLVKNFYIPEEGDDYEILGLFSTEEAAKKAWADSQVHEMDEWNGPTCDDPLFINENGNLESKDSSDEVFQWKIIPIAVDGGKPAPESRLEAIFGNF